MLVGPGNNGGDGLVAARHLHHFGHHISVCYPKRTDKPLYNGLVTQLESLKIPFLSTETVLGQRLSDQADIVVDSLFGFSFKGAPRSPFDSLIAAMAKTTEESMSGIKKCKVVSVDVPSGWNVEEGDVSGIGFTPNMLISLTAPKLCAKNFHGEHHYLGGRFVPPEIIEKYELKLPSYPGSSMCVKLDLGLSDLSSIRRSDYSLEEGLKKEHMDSDPLKEFQEWFEEARHCGNSSLKEPNAMSLATVDGHGVPSLRLVLLRDIVADGLIFYTNYHSKKGTNIEENSNVAATFYWEPLARQVRFEGVIEKLDSTTSDAYWRSRPREHQLGALASPQSSVLEGENDLMKMYEGMKRQYDGVDEIPRPASWGGYKIIPHSVEFWQGRASRLHDRLKYEKCVDNNTWHIVRLAP